MPNNFDDKKREVFEKLARLVEVNDVHDVDRALYILSFHKFSMFEAIIVLHEKFGLSLKEGKIAVLKHEAWSDQTARQERLIDTIVKLIPAIESDTPLKIFQINMHLQWGGQPNRVLTESKGLAALGHEVWVAGPRGCMLCERARQAGLRTFEDLELRRGLHPLSARRDFAKLKELFRRERFDVIHMHGSQDTWLATLAARGIQPAPALIRSRHNTFPVAGHALNRWLYRRMDWIVTIAPQVNDLITKPTGFPESRITPIFSAPDPARFSPRAPNPKLKEELGIPPDALVIGKVGRLAPEKGHQLFLGAAAIVLKDFPDTRFVCVGKGRSQADLEQLIRDLDIQNNVIFTGFRTDVPDIVALFDIFCLTPASGESLGTSILEAFLMEKPAIATQVGGTGESVHNGETGFLIPPAPEREQIEQIAAAMLMLLRNPVLRRRMGQAGRALALEVFSPENLAIQTEVVYRQALKHRRA